MSVSSSGELTVVSTNADNNTAVVKYVVKCTTGGPSYNYNEQTGTFYIDGTKYTSKYELPENTTTTVFSKQVTVSNASGRKISASYSFPSTPNYGTQEGSDSVTIPILIETPVIDSLSLKSKTLNSLTFSYTLEKAADNVYYKLSSESSYTKIASNSKSGSFTVNNLNPNVSYTINFLARNTSGSTNKDATKSVSGTTYDIGRITTLNNFIHGNNVGVSISNPSGANLNLNMKIGSTTILTKIVNSGSNTINFSDEQLDEIYKKYGNGNTVTATFTLTTAGQYTNSKNCTITMNGNQKTIKLNSSGTIKRGKLWINIAGVNRRAVVWINVAGVWRRGI